MATRPFQRIWALVSRIPRGKVVTYGALSLAIDRALTPVGVGWALRAAPDGALPWHRVVNARGGVSTDGEHPGLQRAMLESEGVEFGDDGCVDLDRYAWRIKASRAKPDTSSRRDRGRRRRGP